MSDDVQEVVSSGQEEVAPVDAAPVVEGAAPVEVAPDHKGHLARIVARLDVIGVNLDSELTDLIAKAKAIL